MASARQIVTSKENPLLQTEKTESKEKQQVKGPDTDRGDLAKWKSQSALPQLRENVIFVNASITEADLETWKRLKLPGEPRYSFCLWRGLPPWEACLVCYNLLCVLVVLNLKDALMTTGPFLFQFSGGAQNLYRHAIYHEMKICASFRALEFHSPFPGWRS